MEYFHTLFHIFHNIPHCIPFPFIFYSPTNQQISSHVFFLAQDLGNTQYKCLIQVFNQMKDKTKELVL
ncbi:hypothetical protein F2Z84_22425 [Bacteroides fragilis]|uniref:Uncharacterized protein n=1 Tax=Bacteroides fragilis TaxID=817 RepID=A0A5M5WN96_BACFG|nr:hypothetical protein F2Z30_22400 [Bacteroides fragilis]KAA5187568.1 hypothetical protein F2Z50_22665 [Bacteroides fragilis]KAA5193891.1 hypothetical protein F2Z24_22875 [Bacteroides fragilis]KAA5195172.1 hypothetical protein F2Z84_22425 [Bacteroides fragilis]KAA5204216.1 hypothetical protein F2Z25_22170 [Bacteroides fragilis]